MRISIPAAAMAGLFVGTGAISAIQSMAQQTKIAHPMTMAASPSAQLHEAMLRPMKNMKPMTGNTDKDFASMMAAHHQSAVEMAKIELAHGQDPVLKKMAKSIIQSQTEEIKILLKHAK